MTAPRTDELDDLRHICRGLLAALDEERRAGSISSARLGMATRIATLSDGSRYRFPLSTPIEADEGAPVLVRIAGVEIEGVVSRCTETELDLDLSEDRGATLEAGAELLLESPWLMRRLSDRIFEAFEVGLRAPSLFNLPGALRTIGRGEIQVAPIGVAPEYENEKRPLNAQQEHAVSVALRSPLSLVVAPAGTGKTLTLGALVEACHRAGLRTLVTAPSNVALDLVMMQVCQRLAGDDGFDQGLVMRVGADASQNLRDSFGDQVALEQVTARLRPKLGERIRRMTEKVEQIAADITAAQCDAARRSEEWSLRRSLTQARKELRQLQQQAREFGRALTSEARVVGATLSRAFLDPHLRSFDVLVVDELSACPAPAVFYAAGLAKRAVLAGDPAQLPAPVLSKGRHRDWLVRDVFQRLDVMGAVRGEEEIPYVTVLSEQHRSAEAICDLQRSLWYGPSLTTSPEVRRREQRRHNVIFGTSALCYVDTSSLQASAYHPWGRTLANNEHAALIADIVRHIDSGGEIPAAGLAASEILILSHYRGQVARIRRLLDRSYFDRGVSARTVHSAQGTEAATAIFDLTLTQQYPTRISSVLTAERPEDEGSRLLAVAASRARSRFVFVGDMQWIERSIAPGSVLGRLYTHLREHGYQIALSEVRG